MNTTTNAANQSSSPSSTFSLLRLIPTLALGLVSSVLTLLLVRWLAAHKLSLMSWYVGLVVPFGPCLVGLGASTGFIAGMWLANLRPNRATYAVVIVGLLAAYFAAE